MTQGLSQLENLESDDFLENLGIMDRGGGVVDVATEGSTNVLGGGTVSPWNARTRATTP